MLYSFNNIINSTHLINWSSCSFELNLVEFSGILMHQCLMKHSLGPSSEKTLTTSDRLYLSSLSFFLSLFLFTCLLLLPSCSSLSATLVSFRRGKPLLS